MNIPTNKENLATKHSKFQVGDVVRLSRSYVHFKPVEESEYLKTANVVRIVDADHVKLDGMIAGFKSWHSDALEIQSQDNEDFECCGQCENCSKNELCEGIDE